MLHITTNGEFYADVSLTWHPGEATEVHVSEWLNKALDFEGMPHTASRDEWVEEVARDAVAHALHPFTCYGRVKVTDRESPRTHEEWLAQVGPDAVARRYGA